jgi:hypothetical protein
MDALRPPREAPVDTEGRLLGSRSARAAFRLALLQQRSETVQLLAGRLARDRGWVPETPGLRPQPFLPGEAMND